MSPFGQEDITAIDADGATVLIESRTRWTSLNLTGRLRFPDQDG